MGFRYVSTLRKKVFLVAPVKCVFLYSSNNSDYVVLENVALEGIKNHSLTTTHSQTFSAQEVLGICLPYVKKYFQWHQ